MDIHQFFSTMGDKVGKFFGFNLMLENIFVMKLAIFLISISLLISSLALLILAISHYRNQTGSGFDFNTISIPDELK